MDQLQHNIRDHKADLLHPLLRGGEARCGSVREVLRNFRRDDQDRQDIETSAEHRPGQADDGRRSEEWQRAQQPHEDLLEDVGRLVLRP